MRNECFVCEHCGEEVPLHPTGSARNHCPFCLCSKHVDADFPGDRASDCGGLMKPIGIDSRKNKGYVIVHQCSICGKEIVNQVAPDDAFLDFVRTQAKLQERGL